MSSFVGVGLGIHQVLGDALWLGLAEPDGDAEPLGLPECEGDLDPLGEPECDGDALAEAALIVGDCHRPSVSTTWIVPSAASKATEPMP